MFMPWNYTEEDQIGFQISKVTSAEKDHQAVVRVTLTREGAAFLIAFEDETNGDRIAGTDLECSLTLEQAFDLISGKSDPFTFVNSLRLNIGSLAE